MMVSIKRILILLFVMSIVPVSAQVGIKTEKPLGTFHIDSKGNNTSIPITATEELDDVIVDENGNVGIGTSSPSVKLHIKTTGTSSAPVSGIKISDGSESDGKVLTSGADGTAVWEYPALHEILGTLGAGYNVPLVSIGTIFYPTGSSITLPPGKWKVHVTMLMTIEDNQVLDVTQWSWLRSSFSDLNGSTVPSPDIVGNNNMISGIFQGPAISTVSNRKFNTLQGAIVINNQTGADKVYHYVAGNTDSDGGISSSIVFKSFGGSAWSENIISATPIL